MPDMLVKLYTVPEVAPLLSRLKTLGIEVRQAHPTEVVIIGSKREELRALLRRIEQASGKGVKKWTKATRKQRQAYMERVIQGAEFREKLFYAHFENTVDYLPCVLHTVAQATTTVAADQPYQVTVLIDGLGRRERHRVGSGLHKLKVKVKKVRGLRDESDAFIRLADAIAGFVRDYLEGQVYVKALYEKAVTSGVIRKAQTTKNPRG